MKKIRLLATAAILASGAGCMQAEYMHIRTSSGWEVLDLNVAKCLTFKGGNMTALDADHNPVLTVSQANLETMYVSDTSSVASIEADDASTFSYDATTATVRMLDDCDFTVFSADGNKLVEIPSVKKGETISLAGMAPGIVILRSGSRSVKTMLGK